MTTTTSVLTLKFKEVKTVWDVLELRRLRNECRSFMTHDQRKISVWGELRWFYDTYKHWEETGYAKAYLVCWQSTPVAYGFIRNLKIEPILSGGVSKQFRGWGFGEKTFRFLLKQARGKDKKKVVLDVLETNKPAVSLYKKLKFKETNRSKGIIYMEYE